MWKRWLRPTNRRVRLLVGLLLAGLFCVQCTRSEASRESKYLVIVGDQAYGANAPEVVSELEQQARQDPVALLERCLENYNANYHDFTCTFIKQERLRGVLGEEQEIDVKHLQSPFSVAMAWVKNSPLADRLLYVEGRDNNQMRVRPKAPLLRALVGGSTLRSPDGPEAMQSTLRPVNFFGFGRGLKSLIGVYRQAQQAGDLKSEFAGYAEVGADADAGTPGRKCMVLVRYLPAKDDYPAYKTVTYIDVDYLVPICIEAYNWDKTLQCRYFYKDITFNTGLSEEDFTPQANDMQVPK